MGSRSVNWAATSRFHHRYIETTPTITNATGIILAMGESLIRSPSIFCYNYSFRNASNSWPLSANAVAIHIHTNPLIPIARIISTREK